MCVKSLQTREEADAEEGRVGGGTHSARATYLIDTKHMMLLSEPHTRNLYNDVALLLSPEPLLSPASSPSWTISFVCLSTGEYQFLSVCACCCIGNNYLLDT